MGDQTTVVLLSGGYDSAFCALRALRRGPACGVFFDYGQPYLGPEVLASQYVAEQLGMKRFSLKLRSMGIAGDGAFADRNSKLIRAVCEEFHPKEVYFGTRNVLPLFDRFGDSNYLWGRRIARKLGVRIRMPCVGLPKWLIELTLRRGGLDLEQLYSTENWRPE